MSHALLGSGSGVLPAIARVIRHAVNALLGSYASDELYICAHTQAPQTTPRILQVAKKHHYNTCWLPCMEVVRHRIRTYGSFWSPNKD